MATLADELLNDFEDSGSEDENEKQNGFHQDEAPDTPSEPHARKSKSAEPNGSMELDDDEEDAVDEEAELGKDIAGADLKDAVDEEEAKAKVEKMQLGGVSDVRNVAGLMKTLEPVLEVSQAPSPNSFLYRKLVVYMKSLQELALTCSPSSCRKSPTTSRYRRKSRRRPSDRWRITLNITS